MKHIFPFLIFSFYLLVSPAGQGQGQANVLFVGNSYTEVNNLPQMTAEMARSMGYEMTYSSNTPGGCTFQQHCTNQSMTLIQQGGWDFVVLQEQSQYPSFPQSQVEAEVFPYAARLVEAVYAANPCAEPMFYMTWGRRDGDQGNARYFPILGTYEGMDSMLCERYLYMAEANDASVCPVGRVWRSLRENHPDIELYQSDGSHPSVAGTYAAACAFAVMFFHGDPATITHTPDGLDGETAATIRQTVREVVFNQQARWQRPKPQAEISVETTDGFEATLRLHATHADSILIDFGDTHTLAPQGRRPQLAPQGRRPQFTHLQINTLSTDTIVSHTYADTGTYRVTLVVLRHCMADTAHTILHIVRQAHHESISNSQLSTLNSQLSISPNPSPTLPVLMLGSEVLTPDKAEIQVVTPDGRTLPYGNAIQTLPAGVYLIRVQIGGQTYQGKYLKQ